MMDRAQDLFIPFRCCFVPEVGFGNGWFASSDWPENKRERGVIFDPFFESRNIVCSGLSSKLCFPLREIDFVTENSLPARGGVGNSSEVVVFYRGTVARPGILASEGFSNALRKKQRIPGRKNCYFKEEKEPIAPIIFGG